MKKELMLTGITMLILILISYTLMIKYYYFIHFYTWVYDKEVHHKLIPKLGYKILSLEDNSTFFLRTNKYGFNDKKEYSDNPKIILLGDSQTGGDYVKENFAKILDKNLKNYEIINTAIGSYSPIIHYNFLKFKGLKMKPKIIILDFDMTDVSDDYRFSKEFDGEHFKKEHGFIYMNGRLAYSLYDEYLKLHQKSKSKDKGLIGTIQTDNLYSYTYKNETEFKDNLKLSMFYINKTRNLALQNKMIFILNLIPHSPQLFAENECFRENLGLEKNKI